MLMAARPVETDALDLFKLVLELVERHQAADQPALSRYFEEVLAHAKALASSNFEEKGAITPDAIQLALTLAERPDIADRLKPISRLDELSSDAAMTIRRRMDEQIAC
jgi:hypothetical protein